MCVRACGAGAGATSVRGDGGGDGDRVAVARLSRRRRLRSPPRRFRFRRCHPLAPLLLVPFVSLVVSCSVPTEAVSQRNKKSATPQDGTLASPART